MQMIFPQERQFGAARSRSWRVAMQGQYRFLRSAGSVELEARVGLVVSSRERRAEERSERSEETPRIEVPPVTWILDRVVAAAEFFFLAFEGRRSDVSVPAALVGFAVAV